MPLVMPEDYTDDKEQVGADPAEVAARRAAMRDSSVAGGGQGDGVPRGQVQAVPPGGLSADREADKRAAGQGEGGQNQSPQEEFDNTRSKRQLDKVVQATKALAGNKKALIGLATGGGIVGLIAALLIFYAQFKLIHVMEDLERHFGARDNHAIQARMSSYMREYFADHLNGSGVRVINDATASFSVQIMHALYQGGMDSRLEAGGFGKGGIRVSPDYTTPSGKIIIIKDPETGKTTTYRTADPAESTALRDYTQNVMEPLVTSADDSASKAIWFKYSLYTRLGVGSIFDPLYALSNKIDTAKSEFVQGTLEQIYSIPGVGDALDNVIDALLGGSDKGKQLAQQLKDSLSGAADAKVSTIIATANLPRLVSNTVTKFLADAAGDPFGLAAIGVDLSCHAFITLTNGDIPREIQKATELTQEGVFQRYASAADEIKEGTSVNAATVSAVSSTLSSTDNSGRIHDVSESNNFARVDEQPVPYTPTTNCSSYAELCVQKQATQRVNSTVVGQGLAGIASVSSDPLAQIIVAPGAAICSVAAGIIDALNQAVAAVVHAALSPIPGANAFVASITGGIGGFIGGAFDKVLGPLIVPVVDSSTAGPDLYNELAAGADTSFNVAAGSPAGTDQTMAAQSSRPNTCQAGETGNNGNPSDQSLCGHALTTAQLSLSDEAIEDQEIAQYQSLSPVAKIASLNTPFSLASRVIDTGPSTPQEAVNEVGGAMVAMINPRTWVRFFADIPSWFVPKLAAAGSGSSAYVVLGNGHGYAMDQLGVTQYGFTEQELQNTGLDNDGSLHNLDVAAGCTMLADVASQASASTNIDVPQQCQQFLQTGSSSGGSTPTAPPSGTPITGSVQDLANQVLANSNITFTTPDAKQDVQDAANGQPSPTPCVGGSVMLKAALLSVMLEEAQKFQIGVGYITNGCHASGSYHYSGAAFDTDTINGSATDGRDKNALDLLNYTLPQLPSGSGIGQQGCGPEPDPSLPSGIIQFADSCNHLHLQVPR